MNPYWKVYENRMRRRAQRQGYQLLKSRRRNKLALDYGVYTLTHDGKSYYSTRFLDLVDIWLNQNVRIRPDI